ncbi:unnamed protein product [Orchesella dallaii]|uniref:Phospholipid/glycerol acyltransferase domain-containing protein n=1 Tax=Orchesella dallaii TaxID=48710 RepID=A0ABP1PZ71_9HEXA
MQMQNKTKRKKMTMNNAPYNHPFPFYHRLEVTLWVKIKNCLLLLWAVVKILAAIPFVCLAQLLVLIGLFGMTFEESQQGRLSKWRRCVRWIIANLVMPVIVFCCGFWWKIKEKGRRATPEEAPIFVLGPHSSYFDSFVVILLGSPSIVAKMETRNVPVFGNLVTFTQAVYVTRESKESRKEAAELIKQRAQGVYNGSGMPQIYIYPEGTTGNRSSLIKFKRGAFAPGVPVQPVLIRYRNKFDSVTYTFDGLSVLQTVWYSFTQFLVFVEIEYLPVYVPNEAEKNDANLFGENVRRVMSEALQIPMSDYEFEDGIVLEKLREKTQILEKLRSIHQAKKSLSLIKNCYSNEKAMLIQGSSRFKKDGLEWRKDFGEFQREFYNIRSEYVSIPEVLSVFTSFKKENEDTVDVRQYLVLCCHLDNDEIIGIEGVNAMQERIYQMYGISKDDTDDKSLKSLIQDVFELCEKEEIKIKLPNLTDELVGAGGDDDTEAKTDALRHRLALCIEFTKLIADEVTERLPKTYPSIQDRDKPSLKQKSD